NEDISSLLRGYKFWLPIDTDENENLKTMILSLGGEIADSDGQYVVPLVPSKEKVKADLPKQFYYSYIYDTFMKRKNVPLNKYHAYKLGGKNFTINIGDFPAPEKILTSEDNDNVKQNNDTLNDSVKTSFKKKAGKELDPSKPKKKANKFTKAEDEYILDLVRRNPHLRSTHTFFASIAQLKPLSEHTGNSIRYRYRKVLSTKLEYVYKIDPDTCKPVLDPETKNPIKIEEIPSLIKSQYTAEEDLQLCKHILAYKNGEMIVDTKRRYEVAQIPEYVFQELYKANPRHSIMSWRDRYRKFAAKYGLRKYIGYYERCLERDVEPQPMKNMSSRRDRKDYKVDTFGNEGEQRTIKKPKTEDKVISKSSPESEEKISDIANSTSISALDDNSNKIPKDIAEDNDLESSIVTAKDALEALANLSSKKVKTNDIDDGDDTIANTTAVVSKTKEDKDSNDVIEEAFKNIEEVRKISNVVESEVNDNNANLFVDATEDEMKQYDIALHNTELEVSNTSTDKKDEDDVSSHITEDDEANDVELVDVKADDGLMDFRQLIDIDPEPLKHRDNIDLSTMISNIRECFRNFGDGNTPYELFKDISDQTGISMLWLNYWFDCSCGMLGTFIQAIIHYLKTGELVMNDVSGFWTEKDDELLKVDPNNKDLIRLHGEDSVTKRKAVLF
ncbi:DNA-binding transcription factor rap1, partial [Pichia californica]